MRCSKCGNKVKPDATFCTHCGNKLDIPEENTESGVGHKTEPLAFKTYKKYIIIGLVVICFIGYFFGIRCKSGLCLLPSGFRGEYCIAHTCKRDGCTNKKAADKNYCYTHSPTTTSGLTYTPEVAEDVLKFSDIEITHNSSYTVCTGTITNNGRKIYSFVEVKGKFKDSSGTVLDTDWTYAVGSEGLAPGESTTFRISVDKNRNITKCTMEILDYEKE
jgi:hypothetical protein